MLLQKHKSFFATNNNSFAPTQIHSKLVMQCLPIAEQKIKLNEQRLKLSDHIEDELMKMERLRVTGRQFYKSFNDKRSFKSKSNRIKNIKVVVDNPERIASMTRSIAKRNYQYELEQLQKIEIKTPKQIIASVNRKSKIDQSLISFRSKTDKIYSQQLHNQADIQFYEQAILDNPTLYRKIMCAYNASKRQFQKEINKINIKKLPPKKEISQELKLGTKTNTMQQKLQQKNVIMPKKNIPNFQAREFQLVINLSNRLIVSPPQQCTYKAYICRGNNGLLVKSLVKSRPWWSIRPKKQLETCNLIWTEWKRAKTIDNLPNSTALSRNINEELIVPNLTTNYKKKQMQMISDKKITEIQKLLQNSNVIMQHFDKSAFNENYLAFSPKINQNKYHQIYQQYFQQFKFKKVQKEHKIVNHVPGCLSLHSKKLMFYNLRRFYQKKSKDVFSVLPLTFHIIKGSQDPQFLKFNQYYNELSMKGKGKTKIQNIWICKPGQNSNRGNGISVSNNLQQIKALADQKCVNGRTLIIQKYFENPFLYNRRKFDIRCYILITTVNGIIKGYWYEEGYLRTSSKDFSLKNLQNKYIHLTNDAIQKKGEQYGKFQNFNKVSYTQFQKYLQINHNEEKFKFSETVSKMKNIAIDLIYSVAGKLNPSRKQYSFQIFGLDFMLDDKLSPFLIQANSNPCIEVDGSVLGKVIPSLLQNVIRVAIDPVFPPPLNENLKNKVNALNPFENNKLILVYNSFNDSVKSQVPQCLEKDEDEAALSDNQQEIQI